ncbi:MAG TPA: MlaD family protein [Candidatus Acidoferrales bacterium]|nr:MlaD family protein [Candidatus Acidoferrales bacterium]
MGSKTQQALVGIFVLIAAALLIATVFAMSGVFGRQLKTYHAQFPFAGGLEPGAAVRYSGGPRIGRVEKLEIDSRNPAMIDITFSVQNDSPVRTDSKVKIMSVSLLGDNHLEIFPGSPQAGLAADDSTLPSVEYIDFNALTEKINAIAPQAQELLKTLNDRGTELKSTIDRVNDLLNTENRANISATIASTRGMIEENRPQLRSTLDNINKVSAKLDPVVDDLRKTAAQANQTLDHIDQLIGENRPDIHQAVLQLRQSLASVNDLTGQLNQTLDVNSDNIDELLENFRHASENLKEFTEKIKQRPYLLLRSSSSPEHKPGGSR